MKKKTFLALLIVCIMAICVAAFAACKPSGGVPVTGVILGAETYEVEESKTIKIDYVVQPANATNKSVKWKSSDESVATVSNSGVVKGESQGKATITATTVNGGFEASCEVTVKPADTTVHVENVVLNCETIDLDIGESYEFTASIVPNKATNQNVTWKSSEPTVATVSNSGVVKGESQGKATITVKTEDGGFEASCEVNVSSNIAVTSVIITPSSISLAVQESRELTVAVNPPAATNKALVWESSEPTVATVSNSGVVTGVSKGTATITATAANGVKGTCKVSVTGAASPTHKQYTVKFYDGDDLIENATHTVTEGQKATEPTGVTKKDYTLKGWSLDKNDETQIFDFDTPLDDSLPIVSGVLSLYAVWEADGGDTDGGSQFETTAPEKPKGSPITYTYAGNESAAFEWTDNVTVTKDAKGNVTGVNAEVRYKMSGESDSKYEKVADPLIRQIDSTTARVDIVGLKGGAKYDFKITATDNKSYTITDVYIAPYDRSGYANFNNNNGVGAYNKDGTLKSNARVVYVYESNKNAVTVDGISGSGIVKILQNAGTSKPLVVRIVGTVGAATWNHIEEGEGEGIGITPDKVTGTLNQSLISKYNINRGTYNEEKGKYTGGTSKDITQATLIADGVNSLNTYGGTLLELFNLNSKMKYDASKDEFDSAWNNCSISNVKDVTVEGIGEDAKIFQWGFTWANCNSIEVRNLTFDDYTEDACSFEGNQNATSLSAFTSKNLWIHHNTFEKGKNYWDVCNEQDKHDGDGATDFKGTANVTLSYNRYIENHKTGLVGSGDSSMSANITFHHNYYESCNSRLPMARQANMHMYNNYYKGSTGTNMSLRDNAYAFIENCYFENANKPVISEKGTTYGYAKIYNCTFTGKLLSENDYIKQVAARGDGVTNTNSFGQNFDTDSSLFYCDSKNNTVVSAMLNTDKVPEIIPIVAGVQKHNGYVVSGGSGNTDTPGGDSGNTGGGSGETKETIVFDPSAVTQSSIEKSETVKVGTMDFILVGASGKAISLEDVSNSEKEFEYNGKTYTVSKCLNLGGGADFNASRYIEFTTTAACKITVVAKGGGETERTLKLVSSSDTGTAVTTFVAPTSSYEKTTRNLSSGGTYRLGSAGSGIRICAIIIEYLA